MYSSGRFLFVQFSSDGSVTRRGFSATFSLVSYNYGNALSRLSHAQQHVLSGVNPGRDGGGERRALAASGVAEAMGHAPKMLQFDN